MANFARSHYYCQDQDFVVFEADKIQCDMPREVFVNLLLIDADHNIEVNLSNDSKIFEKVNRKTAFDVGVACVESNIVDCSVEWVVNSDTEKTGKFDIKVVQGTNNRVVVV